MFTIPLFSITRKQQIVELKYWSSESVLFGLTWRTVWEKWLEVPHVHPAGAMCLSTSGKGAVFLQRDLELPMPITPHWKIVFYCISQTFSSCLHLRNWFYKNVVVASTRDTFFSEKMYLKPECFLWVKPLGTAFKGLGKVYFHVLGFVCSYQQLC